MKQVCTNCSDWVPMALITSGRAWPKFWHPMPPVKSSSWLPSMSSMIAPRARRTKTGKIEATPRGTFASRRSRSSRESGPGMGVARRMDDSVVSFILDQVVLPRDLEEPEERRKAK